MASTLTPHALTAALMGSATDTGTANARFWILTLTRPDWLLLAPPGPVPVPVIAPAMASLRAMELLVAVQVLFACWMARTLTPQTLAAMPIGTAAETGIANEMFCRLTFTRPFCVLDCA